MNTIGGLLNALAPPVHALDTVNDDMQVIGYINATGANGGYFNYSDSTNKLSISGGDFYIFRETPQIYFFDQTTTDYNWHIDTNDNIVIQIDALGDITAKSLQA